MAFPPADLLYGQSKVPAIRTQRSQEDAPDQVAPAMSNHVKAFSNLVSLMFALALGAAFGLFRTNDPRLRDFDQDGSVCLRRAAREPAAFGGVFAEFFCVGFIVFGIDFHVKFRIANCFRPYPRKIGCGEESSCSNLLAFLSL
jgi:hypothetical protein